MAEGRTVDTSNNIHYSLQDYSTSIEYFDKRLIIAKECRDQIGQRRAHSNLGNTYLYLEDFNKALYHYREAMTIGEMMNDGLFIAQMCFIIGRVYNIKQEYETSVYFHEKHLNLARQFQDSKGQCRAYLILSQLYEKVNQYEKAKKYYSLYKALAREVDRSNEGKNNFLKNLRAESVSLNQSAPVIQQSPRSHSIITSSTEEKFRKIKMNFMQHWAKKSPLTVRKQSEKSEPDELIDLVCRMQKSRFEDQRCDINMTNSPNNGRHGSSSQLEDIFNTVDRLQQSRLDDQRTHLPKQSHLSTLNEQFFDQIAKCQNARMNDQRAVLLPLPHSYSSTTLRTITTAPLLPTSTSVQPKSFFGESISKTLPDEDFFSLLNRLQTRQTSLSSTINTRRK